MNLRRSALRALALGVLGFSVVGMPHAAELKENTADIRQDITIPGMAVTIKRPGGETGCNTANHEKWDTTKGGCSNTEYMKENAEVVSIASNDYRLSIGVIESTTLTANVRTKDGQLVGAGVPVTWSTSKGFLSAGSSITNAASQAVVTLTTPKGTPKGPTTITATAKGGGTSILVVVANSAAISGLTATPPTALADGSSFITLVATLTYENGASVGAGEGLSWDTKIGNYTYAETVTNTNGKAVAYLSSTVPGTGFASAIRDVSTLVGVTFTSPAPLAPVITSVSATKASGGSDSDERASHVTWSGENLLSTTKYKITLKLHQYCYFAGFDTSVKSADFFPTPGSNSWYLDSKQEERNPTAMYQPQASDCFEGAVIEACNGTSCTSKSFPVPNYIGYSSM